MTGGRDAAWLAALSAAGAAWLAPAWLRPGAALANFGDLYAYHIPLQHLAAARLEAGQLPFWNPYILMGLPHLADPQTALFYPPAALLRLFPLAWAFTLYQAAHLLLALAGAQLLARRLGAGPALAAALGAAYALSPFVAGRVAQGVPTLLASLAWVPWCWLALFDRRAWLLAGTWALQGLSGHPQFAALNALAMLAWAATDHARLRAFLLAGAAAAALALVEAVPAASLLARSGRGALTEDFEAAYSMPLKALAALALPAPFGDPRAGTFRGDPSEWFEEYALHLGAAPLALAAFAAAASPGARAAWALAAAGVALAAGRDSPLWALWRAAPAATLSRVPARFALWTLWGLWLAAALGAGVLASQGRRLLRGAAALAVLAEACWGAGLLRAEDARPYLAPNAAVARALGGRAERVATAPELPDADKTMLYRLMNVNGYAAYYPLRQALYARRAQEAPAADPSRLYLSRVSSPLMARLGVAAVLPGPAGAPFVRLPGAGALALRDGGGRVGAVSARPERWSVRGDGAGPLVLEVPEDPGWAAWVDGAPAAVTLRDGLVMEVAVPDGAFRADFRYAPPLWPWLCAVAALAWGGWLAAARGGLAA